MIKIKLVNLPKTGLLGRHDFLGTEQANGEPSRNFDERRSRCYELVSYALVFGDTPDGSVAVHGSWHGPGAPQRIAHAWLLLPSGWVWEPITAAVYRWSKFEQATQAWEEVRYNRAQIRSAMASSGHYGPWHESRYP